MNRLPLPMITPVCRVAHLRANRSVNFFYNAFPFQR